MGTLAEPPRDPVKELTEAIDKALKEVTRWAIASVEHAPNNSAQWKHLTESTELYKSLLERRKDICKHPNAFPVSSPRTGITEFRCDDCDSYFTQDNNEEE